MTDLAAMSPVSLQASSVEPGDLEQHRVELTAYCYRCLLYTSPSPRDS